MTDLKYNQQDDQANYSIKEQYLLKRMTSENVLSMQDGTKGWSDYAVAGVIGGV